MSAPENQFDLMLDAAPVGGLSVRRSNRARRMSIRVDPLGSVEVVVPNRVRPPEVRSFVEQNRDWIRRARDQMTGGVERVTVEPPAHIELKAIGREREVVYQDTGVRRLSLKDDGRRITISGTAAEEHEIFRILTNWLKTEARKILPPRLEELGERYGLKHQRVQIRAQRSRWGSCSQRGTISLNCTLLLLDEPLVRYLLVHELCHLRHMNHSPRFWQLVRRCEADYEELDRRLATAWSELPGWVLVGRR